MKPSVGRVNRNILHFIKEYLQPRGLLRQDFSTSQGRKRIEYQTEDHFWQDVMCSRKIYETCQVKLKNFLLCPWIPRAPGQYYTSEARDYRSRAEFYVRERNKSHVVFDPYGKTGMVKGGIGCLRLAQKQVGNESLQFLCATSSGVTHKGLLIGLRRDLYERLIEDIEQYGGISCSIIGRIRYWLCEDMLPTHTPRHFPRMYLYAERIQNVQEVTETRKFDVTAAVLFQGKVEGDKSTFFVYSRFNPGIRGSLDYTIEQCVDWMENSYVRGLYSGKILTDFDEVTPRFDDVTVPIKALMNPDKDAFSVVQMCSKLYEEKSLIEWNSLQYIASQVIIEKSTSTEIDIFGASTVNNQEGDTYHIGQAGAAGRNARSDFNNFYHSEQKQTLAEAAAEIQQLLKQLEQSNPNATQAEKQSTLAIEIQQEIKRNPTFKARLRNAFKEGGIEALKVLFAPIGIPIEMARGWIEAEAE